jgi:hypothetical protein
MITLASSRILELGATVMEEWPTMRELSSVAPRIETLGAGTFPNNVFTESWKRGPQTGPHRYCPWSCTARSVVNRACDATD